MSEIKFKNIGVPDKKGGVIRESPRYYRFIWMPRPLPERIQKK